MPKSSPDLQGRTLTPSGIRKFIPATDDDTKPGIQTNVIAQQLMSVFDGLSAGDRQLLLILSTAFGMMTQDERLALVEAAENVSGLTK